MHFEQEPRYCLVGTDTADCAAGGHSGAGSCPVHAHAAADGGCACDSGYHVNDAGTGCVAGGSCAGHSHVNAAGTACACDDGYRLNPAGTTCEAINGNSCPYTHDQQCDDGSLGGPQYCAVGTDVADCTFCQGAHEHTHISADGRTACSCNDGFQFTEEATADTTMMTDLCEPIDCGSHAHWDTPASSCTPYALATCFVLELVRGHNFETSPSSGVAEISALS